MANKKEFIDRLAKKGYTKKASNDIIDDFIAAITEALMEGEEVRFHGFGTFSTVERGEQTIRDFQTGNLTTVPAHKAPKFSPAQRLKLAVREGFIREE